MKRKLKKYFKTLFDIKYLITDSYSRYVKYLKSKQYGYLANNVIIEAPIYITNTKTCFFHEATKLRRNLTVINNTGKFIVKKYSALATGITVVTGNHRPTVGIPHIILGSSHINDKETDIIIEEEVWVGVNCTLLAGTHLGRGCIIGACSMVNKEIPPYAVAVGVPAKVIASVFAFEEIIEHENKIYPENERFSREYLEELFTREFEGKKSIGTSVFSEIDAQTEIETKRKMNITY